MCCLDFGLYTHDRRRGERREEVESSGCARNLYTVVTLHLCSLYSGPARRHHKYFSYALSYSFFSIYLFIYRVPMGFCWTGREAYRVLTRMLIATSASKTAPTISIPKMQLLILSSFFQNDRPYCWTLIFSIYSFRIYLSFLIFKKHVMDVDKSSKLFFCTYAFLNVQIKW